MSRHQERPAEAELLQGTLDMLILKVVALRPIHGYAIVQRIQEISKDALDIRQGSLYPSLYRLENRGWLKAEWRTTEGGRDAKFYSLTPAGVKRLKEETRSWNRTVSAVASALAATPREA